MDTANGVDFDPTDLLPPPRPSAADGDRHEICLLVGRNFFSRSIKNVVRWKDPRESLWHGHVFIALRVNGKVTHKVAFYPHTHHNPAIAMLTRQKGKVRDEDKRYFDCGAIYDISAESYHRVLARIDEYRVNPPPYKVISSEPEDMNCVDWARDILKAAGGIKVLEEWPAMPLVESRYIELMAKRAAGETVFPSAQFIPSRDVIETWRLNGRPSPPHPAHRAAFGRGTAPTSPRGAGD